MIYTQPSTLIQQMKETRRAIHTLRDKQKALFTPAIKDLSHIPEVIHSFLQVQKNSGIQIRDICKEVNKRRQILFIILLLYSPARLLGGQLPRGLRKAIAIALPGISPCTISQDLDKIYLWYNTYKEFSKETDRLYTSTIQLLREKGIIPPTT